MQKRRCHQAFFIKNFVSFISNQIDRGQDMRILGIDFLCWQNEETYRRWDSRMGKEHLRLAHLWQPSRQDPRMVPWFREHGNCGNERMAAERLQSQRPATCPNKGPCMWYRSSIWLLLITKLLIEQTTWGIQSVLLGINLVIRHNLRHGYC